MRRFPFSCSKVRRDAAKRDRKHVGPALLAVMRRSGEQHILESATVRLEYRCLGEDSRSTAVALKAVLVSAIRLSSRRSGLFSRARGKQAESEAAKKWGHTKNPGVRLKVDVSPVWVSGSLESFLPLS